VLTHASPQKCILDALACEPSLEAAVEHLLSIELIRGVQRTGAWPDEPEEDNEGTYKVMFKSRRSSLGSGSAHSGSAHTRPVKPVRPPKKAATLTIPLVDTLQRRAPPVRRAGTVSGSATPRLPGGPSTDVWSAFASLAAYLSDTLPRAPATFFTSFLHSPDYMCAHEAVLAALSNLASTAHIDAVPEDAVEIIEDVFGVSLADEGSHDLELCTRAAEGDVGAVMDLMDLLTELMWWPDYEAAVELRRDPFDQLAELHRALPKKTAKAPTPAPATSSPEPHSFLPTRAINANRLQRPKSEEPQKRDRVVPGSRPAAGGYTSATPSNLQQSGRWAATGPKGAPISWKTVAKDRPRPTRGMHPLAASIPAYARGQLPQDQRPGTLAAAQRESGTAAACYEQSDAEWARRAAAMRAAAQHFRAGGQRHVGASVAGHYAAQARAAGDAAREWELRAARIVVDAQMDASGHTVDLHYATADQAATLALEAAERWWNAREGERLRSAGAGAGTPRPLIVVTGKGTHSAGKRGVLGPSVAKALADEGWRVERFEGYVAVKGRR
jgi:hypothetical protein